MGIPNNVLALTNGKSFNLSTTLGAGVLTLTPPSYTGWPTAGWTPLVIASEVIYITDLGTHPWPITRGEESTTPASHTAGSLATNQLTAGALTTLIAPADKILTDAVGNILVDDAGNVLVAT